MAFQFRLEKVLALREKEKDLSEIEYSEAINHFELTARKLYETLKQKEKLEEYYEKRLKNGVRAEYLRQFENHLRALNMLIVKQETVMHQARLQMEKKKQKTIEKTVEVKKYETLKEKQFHLYIEKQKKEESKQLDEVAIRNIGERYEN